jgi:CheY-like chemotaxis protein
MSEVTFQPGMPNFSKILLVDDDNEDHVILHECFLQLGVQHQIDYLFNGEQAIQYLSKIETVDDLPKLVVMDLNMPIMSGLQALKEIKADPRLSSIPIIVYSTSKSEFEKANVLALGAIEYIVKPMTNADCQKVARHFAEFLQDKG